MKRNYLKRTMTAAVLMGGMYCLSACAGWKGGHHEEKDHRDHPRQDSFTFALIGDTPYGVPAGDFSSPVAVRFQNVVDDINGNRRLEWVMHAGDIKAGSSLCSDEMFNDRLARYNSLNFPVILTPGDNEWTDCHRDNNGNYLPLERLAKLREVFWPVPGVTIGARPMSVDSQAMMPGFEEFPENVMWSHQRVLFATIHIVGSSNAEADFPTRTSADDAEVVRRNAAAAAWLDEVFARARQRRAPGVFIMIHGNPDLEFGGTIGPAFLPFLTALEQQVASWGKPVVLAHGDSHYFRIDKPALVDDGFLPNFTRVETFGSANYHWVEVEVDPKDPEVFSFRQQIVRDNP